MRFRHQGRLRMTLPSGYMKMTWRHRGIEVPIDRSFQDWASERFAQQTVNEALRLPRPDPLRRRPRTAVGGLGVGAAAARGAPPASRCQPLLIGGWGALIARMERVARARGVVIETNSRLSELPAGGPVIVATSLASARSLLRDPALEWPSGTAALLDMAVTHSKKDGNVSFDMDEGGFASQYSDHDPSLAPKGQALFQGQMPLRPGESKADALARLEKLLRPDHPRLAHPHPVAPRRRLPRPHRRPGPARPQLTGPPSTAGTACTWPATASPPASCARPPSTAPCGPPDSPCTPARRHTAPRRSGVEFPSASHPTLFRSAASITLSERGTRTGRPPRTLPGWCSPSSTRRASRPSPDGFLAFFETAADGQEEVLACAGLSSRGREHPARALPRRPQVEDVITRAVGAPVKRSQVLQIGSIASVRPAAGAEIIKAIR